VNSSASYLWSTGETTPQIDVSASGSISVTVINVCGDSATSAAIVVNVNPLPPTPTITYDGTTLTSSAATGNQWYIDGNIMSLETNQTIVTTNPGSYTVIVTDTVTNCISLESSPEVISGINEISAGLMFNIYPNPNNGQFIIELSDVKKEDYLIEVRNIIGQLIYIEEVGKVSGELLKIDLSEHHQGVYFLSVSNSSGVRTAKLIIY